MRSQAEAELRANGGKPDEAERERRGIEELCRALNVTMREVRRVPAVRWLAWLTSLGPDQSRRPLVRRDGRSRLAQRSPCL